ncbi:MAG: MBG domain-containing protein [Paludibacter sp.]|nr:MBG domain-containing protein [Paludibacter sp.]
MKKITFISLLLLASFQLFGFSGSGSGTSSDPYLVTSASQLDEVRNNLTAYYKQTADIDLSDYADWIPIGGSSTSNSFSGTYDGNMHRITGLAITTTHLNYNGLFTIITATGTVKNLGVSGIITAGAYPGLLAGRSYGLVENCWSSGTINGQCQVCGGLLSQNYNGTMRNCYSRVNITSSNNTGSTYLGGLAGYSTGSLSMTYGVFENCYATGNVTHTGALGYTGGFIGVIWADYVTISNCYSAGAVSGVTSGGFIGYYHGINAVISNSFFDYETAGTSTISGAGSPTGITTATTATMQTASTFTSAGWNTSIWTLMDGNYPKIFWQIPPTVTTQAVSDISAISATGNGNITDIGINNVGSYGVCWNTTGAPTVIDNKTDEGSTTTGAFTSVITDLSPNTTYYVRAYATNFGGTGYGEEVSFTTSGEQIITFPEISEKTYGDESFTLGNETTDKELTVTYTAADPTIVSITDNQATILKAGTTKITATQAGNDTIGAATPVEQNLVVNKKILTVTAENKDKTYNGDVFTDFTSIITGFITGEDEGVVSGTVTYEGDAITATAIGTYTIVPVLTELTATNYTFEAVNGTLTISQVTSIQNTNTTNIYVYSKNGQITINSGDVLKGDISVYNTMGQLVTRIKADNTNIVINGYFVSGIYFVTVNCNGINHIEKVILR